MDLLWVAITPYRMSLLGWRAEMGEGQSGFTATDRNNGAWGNLTRFRWTNGQIVRCCPGYERLNVSFTAGNVEINLGVAVFLLHPHMSRTGVG